MINIVNNEQTISDTMFPNNVLLVDIKSSWSSFSTSTSKESVIHLWLVYASLAQKICKELHPAWKNQQINK